MRLTKLLFIVLLWVLLWVAPCLFSQEMRPGRYADFHLPAQGWFSAADSAITHARSQLIQMLGDSLDYRPDVFVVDDPSRFDSLMGGAFPDWGAAAAVPHRQLIVIKSPEKFSTNRPLYELLAHEYAHLAVDSRSGWYEVPRWFNEGVAMMVSAEWDWSRNVTLSRAVLFGQLMDLKEIEYLNRFQSGKAHTAYTQSYAAVQYLFDAYGTNAVTVFLDSIQAGSSIDSALMASTGSDYDGFNREYKSWLKSRYNIVAIFMDSTYFWALLGLVVIVGGILAIMRRRKYYRKWEEQEKYQSTDFDYGDPDEPEVTDDDEPWRQ